MRDNNHLIDQKLNYIHQNTAIVRVFYTSIYGHQGICRRGSLLDISLLVRRTQSSCTCASHGIIEVIPRPEDSIDSIVIGEESKLVFEPIPVMNDNWIILSQNLGSSGYRNTIHERLIENDDLNIG